MFEAEIFFRLFHKCMFQDEQNGNLTQKTHFLAGTGENLTCYDGQLYTYHTDSSGDIICGPTANPEYDNTPRQGCRKAACLIEREFAYKIYQELQDPVTFSKFQTRFYFGDPRVCDCKTPARWSAQI